jgi:Na+-driven multidrug efflux pump
MGSPQHRKTSREVNPASLAPLSMLTSFAGAKNKEQMRTSPKVLFALGLWAGIFCFITYLVLTRRLEADFQITPDAMIAQDKFIYLITWAVATFAVASVIFLFAGFLVSLIYWFRRKRNSN